MNWKYFLLASALPACTNGERDKGTAPEAAPVIGDSVQTQGPGTEAPPASGPDVVYANDRFKEVGVQRIGDHEFHIQGRAQIFEASFNWVVEDGHDELMQGHEMTDAGAPEWGAFKFTVDVQKARPNSTLMLILFETSAKDGSRQHEMPIVLY